MLCLFRNSLIHPRLDPVAVSLSWAATFYWLYFAFIEKALWSKIMQGEAIIVDLVFGFPLVLAFAIMIYASVYWSFKLLLVLFYPAGLIEKPNYEFDQDLEEIDDDLYGQGPFGEEYWETKENQESSKSAKSDSNSQNDDVNHR